MEVDESYARARRVRGKRDRRAAGKSKIFGVKKKNAVTGRQYSLLIKNLYAKLKHQHASLPLVQQAEAKEEAY